MSPATGYYLSDDLDMRLRRLAPLPCQTCMKLRSKCSPILDEPTATCGAPDLAAPN